MINRKKLFYIHIPKTAGSSINKHFAESFHKHFLHVEGVEFDKEFVNKYDFVSGHVTSSKAQKVITEDFMTMVTLREPYSYVVSHLCWIRKLADKGEEQRLLSHPKIFQKIALKMKGFDFSNPSEISAFILWLEDIDFRYLHNTQTLYLDGKRRIPFAVKNLNKINFVGVTEHTSEFTKMVSDYFGFLVNKETPQINSNTNKYGFDLSSDLTKKALEPLINKDRDVYHIANKIFQENHKDYKKIKSLNGDFCNIFDRKTNDINKKKNSGGFNRSFEGSCNFANLASLLTVVKPKQVFGVNVLLENSSSSVWTSDGGDINWCYHWLDEQGAEVVIYEGSRTIIENINLAPKEVIRGKMRVVAPPFDGVFTLKLVPIKSGVTWFDKYKFKSESVRIEIKSN